MFKLAAAAIALATAIFLLLFGALSWMVTGWDVVFLLCLVLCAFLFFVAASTFRSARNTVLTPRGPTVTRRAG